MPLTPQRWVGQNPILVKKRVGFSVLGRGTTVPMKRFEPNPVLFAGTEREPTYIYMRFGVALSVRAQV